MNNIQKFYDLRSKNSIIDDSVLLSLFDSLPIITSDEMLGKWKGGDFKTGHWGNKALAEMKWYGKWFKSKFDVPPIICFNDEGKLFSNKIMKGEASILDVSFRGKTSATMIYDGVPIFDHFRKVDNNIVFGLMDGKHIEGFPDIVDNGKYYFFFLERIAKYPAKFIEQ